MMVPLTESLYVEGLVHEKEKILVDIGTGYFAEVRSLKCTLMHRARRKMSLIARKSQSGRAKRCSCECREHASKPLTFVREEFKL